MLYILYFITSNYLQKFYENLRMIYVKCIIGQIIIRTCKLWQIFLDTFFAHSLDNNKMACKHWCKKDILDIEYPYPSPLPMRHKN
jgi:hypothetical protein